MTRQSVVYREFRFNCLTKYRLRFIPCKTMSKLHPIALFAACLLISQTLVAQWGTAPGKYWILLKDKENSPYSLQNPSAFLSDAALERRAKAGVPVGVDDIPVNPSYLEQ